MRTISLLMLSFVLTSCASNHAVREQTSTLEYREIPASGKLQTNDTLASANAPLTTPAPTVPATSTFARIETEESLDRYIGQRLINNDGDYRLLLKDRTMISELSDQAYAGIWKLSKGYLCYTEGRANNKQARRQSDCVLMEADGPQVKLTASRGKGRVTEWVSQ